MNPIYLHINYFERGRSLEDACRLARDLGADGLEFRKAPAATSPLHGDDAAYLDALSRAFEACPLGAVSFGTPGVNLMLSDDRARAAELERAKRFYRTAAGRFPVHYVNLQTGVLMNPASSVPGNAYHQHGSAVATDRLWEQAEEGLRELASLGEELGIRFALETHPCYLHDTVEAAVRLVDAVSHPAISILWDYTNLLLFPNPPSKEDAFCALGGRIASVHLKNFVISPANGSFVVGALSDGIVDVRAQVGLLRASGYTGPLCIESPRSGDREWFARQDLAYLRSLLEEG